MITQTLIKTVRQWLEKRLGALPKDPAFSQKAVANLGFNDWVITEFGGWENAVLSDQLSLLLRHEKDGQDITHAFLGLRYQALAMSLRTPTGRIPFDFENQDQVQALAKYPSSSVAPALDALAELTGMVWLSPTQMLEQAEKAAAPTETVAEPLPEEIRVNPY